MYKRIIIKLSGEALAGNNLESSGKNFDDKEIGRIVLDIIEILKAGVQVSLVVGGGNFWRGRSADSKMDRTKADQIGMLATVMNAIYLADTFRQNGVVARVMTPIKIGTVTKEFSKEEAMEVLNGGGVCIFAAGTGHPFFSTDTITAIRGSELDCDCILYAKSIDGIYNADPNKNKDAVKYRMLTYNEYIEKRLEAIDISAMSLSKEMGIDSLVFGLNHEGGLKIAAMNNEEILEFGTKITSN